MKYSNRCELPENSIGKLILCEVNDETALYGKMIQIEEGGDMDPKIYLKINRIRLTGLVGEHQDIDHQGRILGGTLALIKNRILYMHGESHKFGPINLEAVERCLSDSELNDIKYFP